MPEDWVPESEIKKEDYEHPVVKERMAKKNSARLISKADKYDHCVEYFTDNWHHDMATFWSKEHPDAKIDEIAQEFCAIAHLETHDT